MRHSIPRPPPNSREFNAADLLDTLDDAAKEALFNALSYKRQRSGSFSTTRLQDDYWAAINDTLEVSRARRVPLATFMQVYGKRRYDDRIEAVEDFIIRSCGDVMRPPQKQALRVRIFEALASYLTRCDVIPTPKSLLNATALRLEDAVDRTFPGYARAGLLHRVAPTQADPTPIKRIVRKAA